MEHTDYDCVAPIFKTDGYKQVHADMYPPGTTRVYSNWTNRKSRMPGADKIVHFGLQAFLQSYLMDDWRPFFEASTDEVCLRYHQGLIRVLGQEIADRMGTNRIAALHRLGYIPLRFCALPEGSLVPIGVPPWTVENTHDDFWWMTNFVESPASANYWPTSTCATIAHEYKKIVLAAAKRTGGDPADVDWQCHGFEFRGMFGDEAPELSGAAHLLSFNGTDSLPALGFIDHNYGGFTQAGPLTIPASEHSVMSAGIAYYQAQGMSRLDAETKVFERLLDLHPTGKIAIVSDTFNLWDVLTEILPRLKDKIMARDGQLIIRPDCYDDATSILTPRGWVKFNDLVDNDEIAQVHPDGTYTFVTPLKRTNMDYNGFMIGFNDYFGKCNLLVTPNHRMLWHRRKTGNCVVEAGMSTVTNVDNKMYRAAAAAGRGELLSALDRLRIAFQADGSHPSREGLVAVKGRRMYRFNFAKSRKTERLISICNEGGFEYRAVQEPARPYQDSICVWLPADIEVTKNFSWVDLGKLCGDWCREFVEELSHWDGSRRHAGRFKFDTTNAAVMDVVEIVALSAGYGVLVSSAEDNRQEHFSDVYTAHILKDPMISSHAITKEYQWYTGKIHCVTVPTGMLLVKRGRGTAVCGNSGEPEKILCGDPEEKDWRPRAGVIELLAIEFGHGHNDAGFEVLDPHVGTLYGDSINIARADQITTRVEQQGFVSTTPGLGIGSYSYQYITRDTLGSAMKATAAKIDGKWYDLFKDPITDDGTKRSAKGRLAVFHDTFGDSLELVQQATAEQESDSLLQPVWEDGKFLKWQTFDEVRAVLNG